MRRWSGAFGIGYALFMLLMATGNYLFWTRYPTSSVPTDFRDTQPLVGGIALTVLSAIAAFIVARRPTNRIGWILVVATFTAWFSFQLANVYVAYGVFIAPGSLPDPLLGKALSDSTWVVFFVLLMVALPLMFPDGRLLTRRWRWVLILAAAAFPMVAIQPLDPAYFEPLHLSNPYGISALDGYSNGPVPLLGAVLGTLAAIASLVSVVIRYRRSGSEVRHQIKWFGAAIALLVLVFVYQAIAGPGSQNGPLVAIGVAGVGAAIAVAVLKYRLYDIDVVISRTLVYGSLAAFITAVYVGIVVGVGTLVGAGGRPNLVLSIVATAVVAVAFQPVREWLQKVANRLVYGKRATPYEVLSQFSERVAETYAADEALPRMARVLAEGTGAEQAQVWLRSGGTMRAAATWPDANGSGPEPVMVQGQLLPQLPGSQSVPVRHQGELLGALTVAKRQGEPLTPVEEKLLADLAAQAGLVLKNVGLTAELLARLEDLRASRQRLVAAQDEERRRLERNLHDGAQQNLVALKVKLGLAEILADKDPEKAGQLLGEIKADTDEALETLRDLARGIYPPLLADKGLAAALESQARKATLPVSVDADAIGRYPQDTEAAVYFCVLEALQNVQKYAGASKASVQLQEDGGALRFEIQDDGKGFDPATRKKGSGMQNMEDRLDALGGSVAVQSRPGQGTSISGVLPLVQMAAV